MEQGLAPSLGVQHALAQVHYTRQQGRAELLRCRRVHERSSELQTGGTQICARETVRHHAHHMIGTAAENEIGIPYTCAGSLLHSGIRVW